MTQYPKRLIEVDLPIKKISEHARREKSIRHGHISTLHIWWARRPLAACRAVLCASLWPDPVDPTCPEEFKEKAAEIMRNFWDPMNIGGRNFEDPMALRQSLLDFIADFANWDNSNKHEYLKTSRELTQISHKLLGGTSDTKPLVVDPFAGGGAIPLEALRVGANSFASDLNPVASLINKVTLEIIPGSENNLAQEVRKWGSWVKQEAEKELKEYYPCSPQGSIPIAYFWTRTVKCEGPNCGAEIPLIRSLWLSKKPKRPIALQLIPNFETKKVDFQIIHKQNGNWVDSLNSNNKIKDPKFTGTVKGGAATCPFCDYTVSKSHVREQLKSRHGGTKDPKLICVVTRREDSTGRFYRLPNKADIQALENVKEKLMLRQKSSSNPLDKSPDEPTPEGKGKGAGRAFSQRKYGMETFADVYTYRQLLTLLTFSKIIREADKSGMTEAIKILCAFALGRVNDLSMSFCRWLPSIEAVAASNGGQNRMPVVFDFIETNVFGGSGGDWEGQIDWVARVVENVQKSNLMKGTAVLSPAQFPLLPDDSADALVTDPPYYDAFPYSDLSDFFYIWLKRSLGHEIIDFSENLVPKENEIVVYDVAHGSSKIKDSEYFQKEMTNCFVGWRKVVKPSGIGLVVFANKTTQGWETLIQSIIDAGWIATASWPIDTERPNRQRAIGSAALASSIHVVCRPRENPDGSLHTENIAEWRDVLQELPNRIHDWMPRLAEEGVVGADAIFACLGPALEIFSRYSKVEKASGEEVTLREYLEHVWGAVSREALNMIFEGADSTGFEEDARLTAMWLWTLKTENNGHESFKNGDEDEGDESRKSK